MPDLLSIEQLGDITIYTFNNTSEAGIDAWEADAAILIESTPPGGGFRILMDVSAPQVSFSRYAREKSQALFLRVREHKGRYAFLFSSPIAPYYSRIFFASLGKLSFEFGYFTDREKAIAWLSE